MEDGHFYPEAPLPSHPTLRSFSFGSQCRPFSILALRQRRRGWSHWDKGTGQTSQLLPQDPLFLPPLWEVKRGLFERQKKTERLLEQRFNCYQIPLIILGQEPGETRLECSICSHTFPLHPAPQSVSICKKKRKTPKSSTVLFTTLPGPQLLPKWAHRIGLHKTRLLLIQNTARHFVCFLYMFVLRQTPPPLVDF